MDASRLVLAPPGTSGFPSAASVLMLVGIGFLSVPTAAVASYFVKLDTGSKEVIDALNRIETDVAELKARLPAN